MLRENGNVGIGTDDPQARLHVEGDVLINGNLRFEAGGAHGDVSMGQFTAE